MPEPTRTQLLHAAFDVWAEAGSRGATTRAIADRAGVNEVTLFRLFGSKQTLLAEAIQRCGMRPVVAPPLPEVPRDPVQELGAWCAAQHTHLMESREMIRRSLAEIHEQPEAAPRSCEGPSRAHEELVRYARALERAGLCERITDARAAASMLTSAIFADAMHRDLMPNCFPQPVSAAPAAYARLYLRALGVDAARLRRPARARRAS